MIKNNKTKMNFSKLALPLLMSSIIFLFSCKKVQDAEQPAQNGLVSFYNFQGNADDVFGNNNGIDHNVRYLSLDFHNSNNQVLLLTGINSYVKLPDSFDYEAKTINLWFNVIESTTVLGVIYSSDNPNLKYGLTLLNIQLIDSHNNLYFNVSNQQDTVEIAVNTWYNATIVTDGKKYIYYLNGNSIKSGDFNNYVSSSDGNPTAELGCDRYLNQRFFNGLVGNLRIYNRKLSDNEIKVLYKAKD
jgi:hypothetical protein